MAETHYSPEHINGLQSEADRLADLIRAERTQFCPEPHTLEGGPLLVWQRLNTAQAMVRKAAELLHQAASPGTAQAIDPDEIAELETMAGFTQEVDERISAGVPVEIELDAAGQPVQAAPGPPFVWPEEDQPWRSGGEVPGG